MSNPDSGETLSKQSCLPAALKEAQDTVRSYDTKAQIVGVGFIFSIGIIANFSTRMPHDGEFNMLGLIISWALAIGPIVMFGLVLFPSRKTAPNLAGATDTVRHVLYRDPRRGDLDAYLGELEAADFEREVAYEMLKVSGLRDLKRKRFVRALLAAGVSYLAIVALQLLRLSGTIGAS